LSASSMTSGPMPSPGMTARRIADVLSPSGPEAAGRTLPAATAPIRRPPPDRGHPIAWIWCGKRITAPPPGPGHAPERAILPRAPSDANAAPGQAGTRTADSDRPNARTFVLRNGE
jgi:hypothetical protein